MRLTFFSLKAKYIDSLSPSVIREIYTPSYEKNGKQNYHLHMEELNMANNNSTLEMITVVDEYGCVVSVEFIHREHGGDRITIERKNGES